MSESDDSLVEVWRAWGDPEAQLIQGLLAGSEIDSALRGESTRLTHAFTLDGLAEVRILVRERDLRAAGELIAQSEGMTLCQACGRPARVEDAACRYCAASLSETVKRDD